MSNNENAVAAGSRYSVEVENLTLSFRAKKAKPDTATNLGEAPSRTKLVLKDLSFKLVPGDFLVVVGLNGSGKSSLLRCLSNLIQPQSGDVRFFGKSIYAQPELVGKHLVRSNVKELNGEFTALENIEFFARLFGIDASQAKNTAASIFDQLKIESDEYKLSKVEALSLGTKAKVALVRALVGLLKAGEGDSKVSRILILDEPILGLDVTAVKTFIEILQEVRAELPTLTIILATNDPRELVAGNKSISISKAHHSASVVGADPLESLRASMLEYNKGVETMCSIINDKAEEGCLRSEGNALAPLSAKRYSALSTIFWRQACDLSHGWLVVVTVVITIVIPQLLALFASAPTRGFIRSYAVGMLGIFISLLMREYARPLERERGWFKSIEMVLTSPFSIVKFWICSLIIGTFVQSTYCVLACSVLAALLYLQVPDATVQALAQVSVTDALGLCAVLVGTMFVCLAFGLLASLPPFYMRPDVAFLVVAILPSLVIICSSAYYPVEAMPTFLHPLLNYNPISYAARALVGFLHADPSVSSFDAKQAVWKLFGLASVLLVVALSVTRQLFILVHRLGKLKMD